MSESMHFAVEGEFVTQLAREKFFMEKDLGAAIRLLMSCTVTDQLSNEEHLMLCLQIINGDAWITGRSDEDSYGAEFREDIDENPTDLGTIIQFLLDMKEEKELLEKENHDLHLKFSMACEKLTEYRLDELNADWYNAYDEPMFTDRPVPEWRKAGNQSIGTGMDGMLNDFMEQCRREEEAEKKGEPVTDYGWLSPEGEFSLSISDSTPDGRWNGCGNISHIRNIRRSIG